MDLNNMIINSNNIITIFLDIDFKQTQAWYLIAECKVKREMTPQQTREWMRENFHFQEIFVDISKLCHRKEHKPKSHNIANIAAED